MSTVLDVPITQPKLMTADELLVLPNNRYGYELVRGELKKHMPAGNLHGFIASRIGRVLGNFIEENDLGAVFAAETGFIIFNDPDTVRAPDAAFVRKEKLLKHGLSGKYFPVAPDLAVEVVSPYDRKKDIEEKNQDYLAAGVQLIWVIYPKNKIIAVHRQNKLVSILREPDELDGEQVLPSFSYSLEKLFGNLPQAEE